MVDETFSLGLQNAATPNLETPAVKNINKNFALQLSCENQILNSDS